MVVPFKVTSMEIAIPAETMAAPQVHCDCGCLRRRTLVMRQPLAAGSTYCTAALVNM